MTSPVLKGRIALVTGASRGIGRATALELAKAGAHVIAVARTVGGLEELDDEIRAAGSAATLVPIDLKDFDAIDRLGAAVLERWGKLDILVGNAGMLGPLSPLGHVEPKAFDEVMAVNVTANWRLIRSLDPLLQASDAGRALFVSSGAAHKTMAYWGPYSISKAALQALAMTYAAETQRTRCASTSSIRGRCAQGCGRKRCRARMRIRSARRRISRRTSREWRRRRPTSTR